ncbi:THAP domain-containing 11 [Paramuricea clavata]|uniref:THAP domain-containing 11 n=1 Tax=Paramuricea clavata TaxID=317549 RepID=A0A6S7G9Y0_PARCT|nr:THAP domain-containing 11 [Paramuricea clavata]
MAEIICSTSANTLSEPFCDEIIKTLTFPKDQTLRNTWIDRTGRSEFTPNDDHHVCSEHFLDGKKTYLNNIPTHDQTPNLLDQRTVLAELSKNTNQINIAIEVDKVNEVQSTQQQKNVKLIEENIQDRLQRLEDELANLKEKHQYERDTTSLKANHSQLTVIKALRYSL